MCFPPPARLKSLGTQCVCPGVPAETQSTCQHHLTALSLPAVIAQSCLPSGALGRAREGSTRRPGLCVPRCSARNTLTRCHGTGVRIKLRTAWPAHDPPSAATTENRCSTENNGDQILTHSTVSLATSLFLSGICYQEKYNRELYTNRLLLQTPAIQQPGPTRVISRLVRNSRKGQSADTLSTSYDSPDR